MSKMSKIDQIHLRAVMLFMSKMLKIRKEHTHTLLLITFLIFNRFSIHKKFWKAQTRAFQPYHQNTVYMKSMSKMSKIDQIHLRAVMLFMSKMLKIRKEHTHTLLLITFLIFNRFSIHKKFERLRLKAFQPYHQIL